jgi:uncharacterized membrane protein YdcZ (DUF606 family)
MMVATKILPEGFTLHREINLQKDQVLLIKLNLWGLIVFPVIGYILLRMGMASHPEYHSIFEVMTPRIPILTYILGLILGMMVVIILHELVHGLFFWMTTGQAPKFGFKGAYAFAAAPEWYINRKAYFRIGAAPLVIITIIGLILIPVIPDRFLFPWLFCILANASGSVGDVYVLVDLMRQPATALIQDRGDRISIYTEASR